VASALGFRSGATPFGHDHTNTTFQQASSKPDISIWQRRGHFYMALTPAEIWKNEPNLCPGWPVNPETPNVVSTK
ncbi:MAG TPA: hypothetical protein VGL82_19010, partial [Bryobacteraceae bacterium]